MDFIWQLHSTMRFAILIMAPISMLLAGFYAMKRSEISGGAKAFIKAFVWVLTFQALIGIVQLVVLWTEYEGALRHRMEHGAMMLVTVGVAHYGMKFLRSSAPTGARNVAIVMAGIIILVVLGILLLPQGPKVLGLS